MNDELCPRCGAFADREIGGIYCANDDCSWGIDGTDYDEEQTQYVTRGEMKWLLVWLYKIIGLYYRIKQRNRCQNCNRKQSKKNEYFQTWGTCDSDCYGDLVGVSTHNF